MSLLRLNNSHLSKSNKDATGTDSDYYSMTSSQSNSTESLDLISMKSASNSSVDLSGSYNVGCESNISIFDKLVVNSIKPPNQMLNVYARDFEYKPKEDVVLTQPTLLPNLEENTQYITDMTTPPNQEFNDISEPNLTSIYSDYSLKHADAVLEKSMDPIELINDNDTEKCNSYSGCDVDELSDIDSPNHLSKSRLTTFYLVNENNSLIDITENSRNDCTKLDYNLPAFRPSAVVAPLKLFNEIIIQPSLQTHQKQPEQNKEFIETVQFDPTIPPPSISSLNSSYSRRFVSLKPLTFSDVVGGNNKQTMKPTPQHFNKLHAAGFQHTHVANKVDTHQFGKIQFGGSLGNIFEPKSCLTLKNSTAMQQSLLKRAKRMSVNNPQVKVMTRNSTTTLAAVDPAMRCRAVAVANVANRNKINCAQVAATQHVGMANIPMWLKSLRLHKYQWVFTNMNYEEMLGVTEPYLESLNITKGARNKLALSIGKLKDRFNHLNMLEQQLIADISLICLALEELSAFVQTPMKPVNVYSKEDVAGAFLKLLNLGDTVIFLLLFYCFN